MNGNMIAAKKAKNDEFYTMITDIEKELKHYRDHFRGKVVFLNCDDDSKSNFWKFFQLNMDFLEVKKVISTHYDESKPTHKVELVREADGSITEIKTSLRENGDFRSPESLEILKEADIVVTNPPFSLFREFIALMLEYNKKFLVIGNNNAVTYKEIFPHIKANNLWLGVNSNVTMEFTMPDHYERWNRIDELGNKVGKVPAISWFTNLEHHRRNEEIHLVKSYTEDLYPIFDNYNAIEVSKVADIPFDFEGAMAVPITFLTKYNPNQFEILSSNDFKSNDKTPDKVHGLIKDKDGSVKGVIKYARIVIKRK